MAYDEADGLKLQLAEYIAQEKKLLDSIIAKIVKKKSDAYDNTKRIITAYSKPDIIYGKFMQNNSASDGVYPAMYIRAERPELSEVDRLRDSIVDCCMQLIGTPGQMLDDFVESLESELGTFLCATIQKYEGYFAEIEASQQKLTPFGKVSKKLEERHEKAATRVKQKKPAYFIASLILCGLGVAMLAVGIILTVRAL